VLWLRPLFCVGSLLSLLAKRKSGREICVSSLGSLVFVCFIFSMDLPRCMKPRRFIPFAISLTASLTVRTKPWSEIGRNRGKKKGTSFKRPMTLQKFRSSLLDFQRPHDKFAAAKTSYRGGPHMRSLISIDFPAPEMEPESACGIGCLRSLAPMRRLQCSTTQATFTNPSLLRATPRYSVVCFNSITQCN